MSEQPNPELRFNDDGTLDEIVANGAFFHMEQQGPNHWWLAVEVGGKSVAVWLHSNRKITASYEETPHD